MYTSSTSLLGSVTSFDQEEEDTTTTVSKELLETYGARLATTKTRLASATKRVVRDTEEFRHLQQALRQGNNKIPYATTATNATSAPMTDAWLKQNLPHLMQRHARALEQRRAAFKEQQQQQQQQAAATAVSPTSVMSGQLLQVDATAAKSHVASPPLVDTR